MRISDWSSDVCSSDLEEYLHSEKYELRPRDWQAPGNIIAEITRLNRIRHENPALQTQLGIEFLHSDNDQVLTYVKHTPEGSNVIVVLVSLDPFHPQETHLDRKSTRLNSSHSCASRMPSSA